MNWEKELTASMKKCAEMTICLEQAVARALDKYTPVVMAVSGGKLGLTAIQSQGVDANGEKLHTITVMLVLAQTGQGTPVAVLRSTNWPTPQRVETHFCETLELQMRDPVSPLCMALTAVLQQLKEANAPKLVVPRR